MGDADGSGEVDVNDATTIQKIAAEMETPDTRTLFASDVNGDGVVSVTDATAIQKYSADIFEGAGVTGKTFWVW